MRALLITATALAMLITSTAAFADHTVCKITGYRKTHFLRVIPYDAEVFSLTYDANAPKTVAESALTSCGSIAWNNFQTHRDSVDFVAFDFRNKTTGKHDAGTVHADNRSLDELMHDRGAYAGEEGDAPSAKTVRTAPVSEHPYGTGGSPADPVVPTT